jgi:hypothetical protein
MNISTRITTQMMFAPYTAALGFRIAGIKLWFDVGHGLSFLLMTHQGRERDELPTMALALVKTKAPGWAGPIFGIVIFPNPSEFGAVA